MCTLKALPVNLLFIDDDSDTNFLIDLLIKNLPYIQEYFIMDSAKEGLDFLERYEKPLTCIFVDIKMPEMDGFEFVRRYEQNFGKQLPDTRVYFVTSSARESDRSRAMQFRSVEEVILKPLTRSKLKEIHEKLIPEA